jgi:ATP-dependent RNA helicase DeaD
LSFKSIGLRPELLKAIEDLGYEHPTPIQEKTIPFLIEKDNDLVGLAQTGTGKTAAFGLPLLQRIDVADKRTQALILAPTRELCLQICSDLEGFSKYIPGLRVVAVYGGASIEGQASALRRGAQIVVGAPGRTLDMIRRTDLRIGELKWLILDEADEMLNRGFKRDLDAILAATPRGKRTLLFSATMPPEIAKIADTYLRQPERISAGQVNVGTSLVSYSHLLVPSKGRYEALCKLLDQHPDLYGIVFCRTKRKTREVSRRLSRDGYAAVGLEGDMTQPMRDRSMDKFRRGIAKILVATDVAARGVDVANLTHVIHFNLPDDDAVFVHRSGRTGRAGATGISIALVEQEELSQLPVLERLAKKPIPPYKGPEKSGAAPRPQREEAAERQAQATPVRQEAKAPAVRPEPRTAQPAQEPKRQPAAQAPATPAPNRQRNPAKGAAVSYRKALDEMLATPLDENLAVELSSLMPMLDELDRYEIVGKFLAMMQQR